jgi:hypothetical protein
MQSREMATAGAMLFRALRRTGIPAGRVCDNFAALEIAAATPI